MRPINRIFLHCSDSAFGDSQTIESWHRDRFTAGLSSGRHIGYHYVVLNGRRRTGNDYVAADDGVVETGRPVYEKGAHVAGANGDSIGVCLVGRAGLYTVAQMRAAVHLVRSLIQVHELSWSSVFGHYQQPDSGKTCPDFQIDHFRSLLRAG